METLTKSELIYRAEEIAARIKEGEIFVHPTDTIYGLGCNALDEKVVTKLRELKNSPKDRPFSIWVPSLSWIQKNCVLTKDGKEWLTKLPGPYTLILKLKNKKAVAPCLLKDGCIGVRLPTHWMSQYVHHLGFPIVTTSVNKAGGEFMTTLENLEISIKQGVRFVIYEGEKRGRPSKIVRLCSNKKETLDR